MEVAQDVVSSDYFLFNTYKYTFGFSLNIQLGILIWSALR